MPLSVPTIDSRSYEELRDEALRRIPVHNPAWTNYNASDPGVTLIELFAFMTDTLLYRVNQVPERNRRAFLALLGVPMQPASSARGIVTISNERGPLETRTLQPGLELRAGQVPFRTDSGLDVVPVEARAYVKRPADASAEVRDQYRQLYASFAREGRSAADILLYETAAVTPERGAVDLVRDTVDASLWIALLVRATDKDPSKPPASAVAAVRAAIAGRTLNLGIVPEADVVEAHRGPSAQDAALANHLEYLVPAVGDGRLPNDPAKRVARYQAIESSARENVLREPGVVELTLPAEAGLTLWQNLEPLEAGAGDFPPALDDSTLADRLVTWVRVHATSGQPAGIRWAGINAVRVTQRIPVESEVLPDGTGDPDQVARLGRRPVIPGSIRLSVATTPPTGPWRELDDLAVAGPEVGFMDLTLAPGQHPPARETANAFVLDAEAGEIRFGDGGHGRRPPAGATIRASYDVSAGAEGNVGPGSISSGPDLPPGLTVANPVRTWGGVDAESVEAAERRVTSLLRHRDRLVTAADHKAIAEATPEVVVGRVDVLPTFDPRLLPNDAGDAPGAVTLLAIPRYDMVHPDTPEADTYFLDAICRYCDPRRLVTSELFVKGPAYRPVWVSVGIEPLGDRAMVDTREAIKRALTAFLSPLPRPDDGPSVPPYHHERTGWPLQTDVRRLELLTYAARVDGVREITGLVLGGPDAVAVERITVRGLELPRLMAVSVVAGDPVPLDQVQGAPRLTGMDLLPVPLVPEAC